MKQKKRMNLLEGSLWDKILIFALPLAASSFIQQLFNAADTAVVGHYAGSAALAAVGSVASFVNLLINLFVGLSIGANVVIAQGIGEGNEQKVREAVHTSLLMAIISAFMLLRILVKEDSWIHLDVKELRISKPLLVPSVITALGACVFRIIYSATVLASKCTFERVVFVYPSSWVVTVIAMLIAYIIIHKRVMKEAISS